MIMGELRFLAFLTVGVGAQRKLGFRTSNYAPQAGLVLDVVDPFVNVSRSLTPFK